VAISSGGACGRAAHGLDGLAAQVQEARLDFRCPDIRLGDLDRMRATGNGVPGRKSRMRMRCTPWQTMWWSRRGR